VRPARQRPPSGRDFLGRQVGSGLDETLCVEEHAATQPLAVPVKPCCQRHRLQGEGTSGGRRIGLPDRVPGGRADQIDHRSKEGDVYALRMALGSVAFVLIVGCTFVSAQSTSSRTPIRLITTCGDFLRTDDDAKPEIVYWLTTRSGRGNPAGAMGVEATVRMVPVLIERCKETPVASLAQTVRAQAEKSGK